MKVLIFSDIHGDLGALEQLMEREADYYVAAGDLVSFGRGLDRCGEILHRKAGRVYALPGNHETETQIARMCRQYGLHDFHGRHEQWNGYYVAGLGYSNPTPFNTPGEYSEEQLEEKLAGFANLKPLVLICHCPPHGTSLDRIRQGVHGGSTAVRDFLLRRQPDYFFCGHIHEAAGARAEIGRTQGVNVGRQGYLLEL